MLPRRREPVVAGCLSSGLVISVVIATATALNLGSPPACQLAGLLRAWPTPWAVAIPVVLVVAPSRRRLVRLLIAP